MVAFMPGTSRWRIFPQKLLTRMKISDPTVLADLEMFRGIRPKIWGTSRHGDPPAHGSSPSRAA